MPFVVHASMVAAWAVADERPPAADLPSGRVKSESACVPDLFRHEMRNRLVTIGRRGRSPLGSAGVGPSALRRLPVAVETNRSDAEIPDLARRHDVTPSDAADLDMPVRCGLPLATLAAAARACGVALPGPPAP